MKLKGKQLEGFNAAILSGDDAKAHSEIQKSAGRAEATAPIAASEHIMAAMQMDWMQVVLNAGPPCFHLCDDKRFCGRAERWAGHDSSHSFVSLADLLRAVEKSSIESERTKPKCSHCGQRPIRGGKRQGSNLCQHCYEAE